uniref:Centromere protein C n=1 Tax=Corvus moneduloides TaxID=1196302 RepID=A0A8C3EF75_CORMO
MQSQRPKAGSAKSVKRAHKSAEPSPASPLKPVSSRGQSCESHLKPATHDYVAASKKPESPVSKREKHNTLKDVEALCQSPAGLLDSEDNRGSPFPVEEVKSSPIVKYSTSISPPSPHPVKHQDIEIEDECEFLIDESGDAFSTAWISIPSKSKRSKNDGSATPISKSQPSEKKKPQNKKVKNRKVQVKALTKQKLDHLDVGAFDLKEMSESDPIPNSEENVLPSQSRKSTHMGKTKKDALRQDSPNQEKNTSLKPEAEELMLSSSGLETKPSDEEQCKTRMLPSEDLPVPSSGHQEEQTVSLKKSLKSSKNLQLASKASQHLVKKKQTAKQKLPKVKVAKRGTVSPRKKLKKSAQKSSNKKPQLQREESSDSEPGEEELEREPVELNEVCTTPLHQKLETPVIQKLTKSEKRRNVLHTPESPGGANNRTSVKALQQPMDSVKNPKKKHLPAKSSGKIPKKIPRRTNKALCSSPEDTESQTDSDSSSVQAMTRKKQKLPDVKIKNNKRKHNSEDLNYKLRHLLSDDIARHKIVMPTNTPNVRRTKRIRLRPLEYWRGERINYTMQPSGMSSTIIICFLLIEQKREIYTREIPASLDHTLADTSKPTIVLDPVTNKEVHLDCINAASSNTYYVKDEAVEIYKTLNTSLFATGRLILKPFKEKGHQFVHMDTIAFHIIRGKVIVTLHKTSYYLTAGDCFYVPAGNGYNIRNLLNEESVLLFTQLKNSRLLIC